MDLRTVDDTVLLAHIIQGQEEALSVLYDRYGRLVYSIAYHIVQQQQIAEEITLDIFRRIWEKADTYRADRAKVTTWLTSMTRNRAIDILRREDVRLDKWSISWVDVTIEPSADGHSPETAVSRTQEKQAVHNALDQLPPDQKEVLTLAYFHGYSQSQIAAKLDLPLGTVKTRVRLAMQKMRDQLIDQSVRSKE